MNRRDFVKSSAILGAALVFNPIKAIDGSTKYEVIYFGKDDNDFSIGVRKALIEFNGVRMKVVGSLNDLSSDFKSGTIFMGMLSNAEYTDFNDFLRREKASLYFSGTHTSRGNESRHLLKTTKYSQGLSSTLALYGQSARENMLIQEEITISKLSQDSYQDHEFTHWKQVLGYNLALVGLGRWKPHQFKEIRQIGNISSFTSDEHFNSFVAKV